MCITIKEISETEYTVDNKRVYKDMTGNWVADQEMELSEIKAFQDYIQSVKPLKNATYEQTRRCAKQN